jgi:hypothetical protein
VRPLVLFQLLFVSWCVCFVAACAWKLNKRRSTALASDAGDTRTAGGFVC